MPLTVLWHVNDKKTVSNWMQRLWTGRQHLRWIINSGTALNLLLPSSNFAEISQWTLGSLARNFKILVSAQNIKPQLFRCLQNEVILAEHPSFKSKEVLESFWDLISNHCFGFWDYFWFWSPTKWEMYGTGAPKPYKGCRSQIFWMNLHFDDEEQRQFHLSGWEPYNQMIVVLWDYRRDWCAVREKEFMCGLWMLFAISKYMEQKMHQTELFKEKIPNGTFEHIRLKFT